MFPNHATNVNQNNTHNCDDTKQSPEQSPELFDYLYETPLPDDVDVPLASISERDSVWDSHRVDTDAMGKIYGLEAEFERYSERMENCSGWLKFGFNENNGMVLKQAFFCRVRYCAMCQWRKSLLWKAMMYQTYDKIIEQYPTHRFVFLTMTVANPAITDLRDTLQHMNKSWKRLINRKEFMNAVDGWVRTTEVTRDSERPNTHAHPHFHIILMVKPSYFGKGYIKQLRWRELWADCLRVDYLPQVDVRTVKPKNKGGTDDGMRSAIAETLKYAVKPDEVMQDWELPESREWFYELTRQTKNLRFVATGGILKDALKPDEDLTSQDLVDTGNSEEDTETDGRLLNFTYYTTKKGYMYNPEHNE